MCAILLRSEGRGSMKHSHSRPRFLSPYTLSIFEDLPGPSALSLESILEGCHHSICTPLALMWSHLRRGWECSQQGFGEPVSAQSPSSLAGHWGPGEPESVEGVREGEKKRNKHNERRVPLLSAFLRHNLGAETRGQGLKQMN